MKLLTTFCSIVLAVALLPLPVLAENAVRKITVTGEARIAVVPDMAMVSLGAKQRAKTAAAAMEQTSQIITQMIERLKAQGVAERDMQTSDLSLYQVDRRSSNGEREPDGFEASNILQVRVRDLDKLGGLLNTLLEDGVNQFNGLSFGLKTPGPVHDQARRDAVAEALRKAAIFADAAGVELGPVLNISESGGYGGVMPSLMNMERAAPVPVAEGEIDIRESVTLVILLKDRD
ncbi:SIMPL domain-containing protein [Thalassovita sp.]|uniref:SIMPL domain-containing protein n=1 Tax=Thalassovita sp. TaxID=1979401 RepID=UPI002B272A49|nr:SIMPL domain-containing protein [Thalassovita sp.]